LLALGAVDCSSYVGRASPDAAADGGCCLDATDALVDADDAVDATRCEGDLTACGRACVSLATDIGHCGACGFACTGVARCEGGRCVDQPSCPDADEAGCGIVEVAGGALTLGLEGAVSAEPSTPVVMVSPFAMDVAEVTIARFRRYCEQVPPTAVFPSEEAALFAAFEGR